MTVPTWAWVALIGGFLVVLAIDLIVVERRPHAFGTKEATIWVSVYFALAMAFCVTVGVLAGWTYGGQFLAGYLTEFSLSVDNLFVFLVLMSSMAVPAALQHRVLLVGVIIALILRAILILIGAELIERFAGIFFLFAAFLFFTAWRVWMSEESDEDPDPHSNPIVRFVSAHVPVAPHYDGTKLLTRISGVRMITPLALVMVAIGATDVLFALDSIPAVFGITQIAFLVFAANAFALMGLRQLYFLLAGLMDRLHYLSKGLAIILAFIAVKLTMEALDQTTGLEVPHIPIWLSLVVIVGVLAVTAAISLMRSSEHGDGSAETPS